MPRFSLIPRDARFFDLFEQAGKNLVDTAHALQDLLTDYTDVPAKLRRIEDLEHTGDRYTHEVMKALHQTFITPFDREDITRLIDSLDDVVDRMWAAASRFEVYHITEPTETARKLADVLVRQAEMLAAELPHLRRKGDMQRVLVAAVEINRLEDEADDLHREGLRALFANPSTLHEVVLSIKWRDLYWFLEDATDRAEDAANVLEAIVLKHS